MNSAPPRIRSATINFSRCAMTIDTLQSFVLRLSNGCHVRWWAHWNYPQSPTQMAIAVLNDDLRPVTCDALEREHFERRTLRNGYVVYVCDRIDGSSNPFTSLL